MANVIPSMEPGELFFYLGVFGIVLYWIAFIRRKK